MGKYMAVLPCLECGTEELISLRKRQLCLRCRFLSFTTRPSDPDACWGWTGGTANGGYGIFSLKNRAVPAHRVAYEILVGQIPPGMEIDHRCHTPECVNPAHLRPVTSMQNKHNHRGAQANSKSGVRGVHQASPGSWVARVYHAGVVYRSSHRSMEEAAEAARQMRLQYHTHNDADRVQSVARDV